MTATEPEGAPHLLVQPTPILPQLGYRLDPETGRPTHVVLGFETTVGSFAFCLERDGALAIAEAMAERAREIPVLEVAHELPPRNRAERRAGRRDG